MQNLSPLAPLALVLSLLLSACTAIPVSEREQVRQSWNEESDRIIAAVVSDNPSIQTKLDSAIGYCTGATTQANLAIIGGAYGRGVCVDNQRKTRTFININRFDLGAGIGAGTNRVLLTFTDHDRLQEFTSGSWQQSINAETSIGEVGSNNAISSADFTAHYLSQSGALVNATARFSSLSINSDLTDTGISDISIPNTRSNGSETQPKDSPRQWNRTLPFLAQQVIDQGYNLPLPYGAGLAYADIRQDVNLQELSVGLNDGDIQAFPFVSFTNAEADSKTTQVKFDAWVLPFMNVFAMIGNLEGQANMDILLDGNGMLDKLGISCPPRPPNLEQLARCARLQDNTINLPINTKYKGTTYGLGTVLAGGWNDWFVAIPLNATYADIDEKKTDGYSFTITPRLGRILHLGNGGNLALFIGGNYLRTELTVSGRVTLPLPGDDLQIDYIIEQENSEPWNAVIGGNWDISKRWSVMAEYNGFSGSREMFVAGFTRRF